jgi:hypothetical protein
LYRLHAELHGILQRFETDDEAWDDKALNARIGELMAAINTTPPKTLRECIYKLKLLAHPHIGIEAGDREGRCRALSCFENRRARGLLTNATGV